MKIKPIVIWHKDKTLDILGKKIRINTNVLFVLSIGLDFILMNTQVIQ